jgi:hypothetical protein
MAIYDTDGVRIEVEFRKKIELKPLHNSRGKNCER